MSISWYVSFHSSLTIIVDHIYAEYLQLCTRNNNVVVAYSVAATLWLRFTVHVILFPIINTYVYFILVLSEVRVQRPVWLFTVVLDLVTGLLLGYFLNNFKMVSVVCIDRDITSAFYNPYALYFPCRVFIIIIIIIIITIIIPVV